MASNDILRYSVWNRFPARVCQFGGTDGPHCNSETAECASAQAALSSWLLEAPPHRRKCTLCSAPCCTGVRSFWATQARLVSVPPPCFSTATHPQVTLSTLGLVQGQRLDGGQTRGARILRGGPEPGSSLHRLTLGRAPCPESGRGSLLTPGAGEGEALAQAAVWWPA